MDFREHIRQDLQPYVCTYEKCPDADRMYASRHAWLEHERLVHRRIWRCFEHSSFISISKNGLLQHFLDCHKELDGQQIENLLDLAETTVADDRQTCPFCYSIGPFDKGFYNHLAFHQEQLATFAVPRNLESNEEADSGRAEGIRSAGSLRSVALDFPDGESSLDSDDSDVSVKKVEKPLLDAAGIGDEVVVRLLLEEGAERESKDEDGQTPLAWAAKNGHEAVVRLLLEKGAERESKDIDGQMPLALAAKNGHEAVVRLLLEKGADVNAQGGFYGNALQAASHKGYEMVVRILLDRGADVNAQGGFYGNALQATSQGGYEIVVRILLDRDADINAQVGYYGNALQAASQGGYEMVVRILLDRGADVNAQGGYYGNALQAASHKAMKKWCRCY
ncbi:hypothetical protein N7523_004396 [Penicillium sp. IBT 18751x]|nr:hypothetical protein N7523_004396 [Penicillium sp. IBT 18751x]